jgi:cell division protein FtsN
MSTHTNFKSTFYPQRIHVEFLANKTPDNPKRMTQKNARTKATTKTKKNRPASRKNVRKKANNQSAPLWAWVLIGSLLAALITLLIYISNRSTNRPAPTPTAKTEQKTKPTPGTPQPRFDFYQILKEREVEVPDRSGEIAAKTPENITYFLQAGSFKSADDADRLRADLILLNMEAKVETASSKGTTWYRVVVGPFQSRSKMAKARSVLASKQLSPLLLKRKSQ